MAWDDAAMRLRLICVLAVAGILLSACQSYQETVEVDPDGTVSIEVVATVACDSRIGTVADGASGADVCEQWDALPSGVPNELIASRLGLDASGFTDTAFRVRPDNAGRRVSLSGTAADASSITTLLIDSMSVSSGPDGPERVEIEVATDRLQERLEAEGAEPGSSIFQALRELRLPTPELTVVVPGRVTDHNGDEVRGRQVTWLIDGDEDARLVVSFTDADRGRRWWWMLVGVAVFAVVVGMMLWFDRPSARRACRERDRESAASERVEEGE